MGFGSCLSLKRDLQSLTPLELTVGMKKAIAAISGEWA
jgi:hypothetical protein